MVPVEEPIVHLHRISPARTARGRRVTATPFGKLTIERARVVAEKHARIRIPPPRRGRQLEGLLVVDAREAAAVGAATHHQPTAR